MIYLYTQKQENDDWILQNDWYFNLYTGNQPFTEEEKQIVERIDGARITDDMHIVTRYGLGTIRNLSTGCKTYLNIAKNMNKVVSAEECGRNVLEILFRMEGARIYMSRPERFRIGDEVEICFNGDVVVAGRRGYEKWWSAEYERRAGSDI
ncbi:MAG: DUF4869 domain-containing protein [Lachnospiraceae bacterium]|nr:DUF4869 domain-containing protein [Lachnospiraceae bacterium]